MKIFFGKIDILLLKKTIIRFIIVTMILFATAFTMPGFEIENFFSLAIISAIIISFEFIISAITDGQQSVIGRMIMGFLISIMIIFLSQFFILGYKANGITTILASLVIGIISGIIPETSYKKGLN